MKKICVLGLGYIGLPTAIVAAEHGLDVVGFDIDESRVERINQCDPVIQEPEIFEKLQGVVQKKAFRATTVIESADCFIIAVPTPFMDDKKADLSYVFNAAEFVSQALTPGSVVILESTVPVGTTKQLADFLQEKTKLKAGSDFYVAHCPERVLPGKIFTELVHNARIIGGINRVSVEKAKEFYKEFVTGSLYLTDATTAEMVKLVENSSRDVAIAFANQVASMATVVGLDPYEVIELANKHPRVNILRPGCGVGGHCIAVDPWFLVESFPQQTTLLKAAREVNDNKPHEVLSSIKKFVTQWYDLHKKPCKILALGLTYKADVDDLRESPALFIAQQLQAWPQVELLICEPHVAEKDIKKYIPQALIVSFKEGLKMADAMVALVAHSAFKELANIQHLVKVLDYCGILHQPRQESTEQERHFWPASKVQEWYDAQDVYAHIHHHDNQENQA